MGGVGSISPPYICRDITEPLPSCTVMYGGEVNPMTYTNKVMNMTVCHSGVINNGDVDNFLGVTGCQWIEC